MGLANLVPNSIGTGTNGTVVCKLCASQRLRHGALRRCSARARSERVAIIHDALASGDASSYDRRAVSAPIAEGDLFSCAPCCGISVELPSCSVYGATRCSPAEACRVTVADLCSGAASPQFGP